MADDPKEIVRRGYDATADVWVELRGDGKEKPWIARLVEELPAGAAVLDLGCGSGTPIAATLTRAGLAVTGVDASPELIARAAKRVPEARFVCADMTKVELPAGAFAAVVAWDSIFHVPATEQEAVFRRVRSWIGEGAPFLLSLGGSAGEIRNQHLGAPMYYAALAPHDALRALERSGFAIVEHVLEALTGDDGDGGYLVVLARGVARG